MDYDVWKRNMILKIQEAGRELIKLNGGKDIVFVVEKQEETYEDHA